MLSIEVGSSRFALCGGIVWEEALDLSFDRLLMMSKRYIKPLNARLNPICHLLAILGAHPILHVSTIRVNKDRVCFLLSVRIDITNQNTRDTAEKNIIDMYS